MEREENGKKKIEIYRRGRKDREGKREGGEREERGGGKDESREKEQERKR